MFHEGASQEDLCWDPEAQLCARSARRGEARSAGGAAQETPVLQLYPPPAKI